MVNTRIAPSPTGYFHLGTARTAYFNWLMARATGGKFLLRIDDTDLARNDEKYVDVIKEALDWLGLGYDGVMRQSQRSDFYRMTAQRLIEFGLAALEDGAIKLKPQEIPDKWHDEIAGDIKITEDDKKHIHNLVLIRSNGIATYNFATVVDDLVGTNTIIRGVDHITNTSRQIAILEALKKFGINSEIKYYHIGLIHKDGKKLSKRDGASNLMDYKTKGYSPKAILNFMLKLGWNLSDALIDQKMPLINQEDAVKLFLQGKMRSAASNFDQNKLDWFDKQYKLKA